LYIDFLHNAGVVHRDLKTTNILLDEDGHAVIIDFGLAKWLHRTERTNTFCGTPHYMGKKIYKYAIIMKHARANTHTHTRTRTLYV